MGVSVQFRANPWNLPRLLRRNNQKDDDGYQVVLNHLVVDFDLVTGLGFILQSKVYTGGRFMNKPWFSGFVLSPSRSPCIPMKLFPYLA